jgi:hypothetical protein
MKDRILYLELENKINSYHTDKGLILAGLDNYQRKDVFIRQMIDSIKRIKYIRTICERDISVRRIDPSDGIFDPIRAAIWFKRNGNIDEAFWFIFLFSHFGKNLKTKWNLLKAIYGHLGNVNKWTWRAIIDDTTSFIDWLDFNQSLLRSKGGFSNHRKYQSLSATYSSGTGATILSYIGIVGPSHRSFIENIDEEIKNDPNEFFEYLFKKFNGIVGFGRLAIFDYLTMIGKIGIIDIEPGYPYLKKATGPLSGTKLLYDLKASPDELDELLIDFGNYLDLDFGMQVLEDCICNWQKTPTVYKYFGG